MRKNVEGVTQEMNARGQQLRTRTVGIISPGFDYLASRQSAR